MHGHRDWSGEQGTDWSAVIGVGGIVVALAALGFTIASFWWLYARKGKLEAPSMDGDRRLLWSDKRWTGNRAVVSEHPNHRAAYLFRNWSDFKRGLASMQEVEPLRRLRFWQPLGGGRELAFVRLMWAHRTSHASPRCYSRSGYSTRDERRTSGGVTVGPS